MAATFHMEGKSKLEIDFFNNTEDRIENFADDFELCKKNGIDFPLASVQDCIKEVRFNNEILNQKDLNIRTDKVILYRIEPKD